MFGRQNPPTLIPPIRAQLSAAAGRVGDLAEAQTVAMIAVTVTCVVALLLATAALVLVVTE